MSLLLFFFACIHGPPLSSTAPVDGLFQFAITGHGQTLAGLAAVRSLDDGYVLNALTPMGTGLFTVELHGTEVELSALTPELEGTLRHIPFERDLPLLYGPPCPVKRCRLERGTLRQVGPAAWRWRGVGGPALLSEEGGYIELKDGLRGYSLRVVLPQ